MMDWWKYAAIMAGILLIALIYSHADSPAGAIVSNPAEGIQCCSFDHNGEMKTCAAPDGQSCSICNEVCAARA